MSRAAEAPLRSVVVTGMGVVSALGDSPAQIADALQEGRSGVRALELFDARDARCRRAAEISDFAPHEYLLDRSLHPLDRTSRLAASAAALALDDSGWNSAAREQNEIGLVLGTMFGSVHTISEFDRKALSSGPAYAKPMAFANSVINAAAGQTAIWHDLRGVNATVSGGTCSALQALAHATDLIRLGRADVVLAGGVEELCFESFYGFDRAGRLCASDNGGDEVAVPFDALRNGFALGEAAGLLVLEESQAALARGASPIAEIRGHGSAFDSSRGRDRSGSAAALAQAIHGALDDAGVTPEMIGCLSASASGSVHGDVAEAEGVALALGPHATDMPVTAVKSMLGETLGAGGALQTVALIEALRRGVLPGIFGLQRLDDAIALRGASAENREIDAGHGLVTSLGLSGGHGSLVVAAQRAEEGPGR
ncbi:MAG: beta-ketoacyl-[acyl-carrier-protein] synthase family protein [Acidobacteriota bacterium]